MKAASVLRARERHPDLRGLLTDTADNNPHMRHINHALGYAPTHTSYEYQLDLRGVAGGAAVRCFPEPGEG